MQNRALVVLVMLLVLVVVVDGGGNPNAGKQMKSTTNRQKVNKQVTNRFTKERSKETFKAYTPQLSDRKQQSSTDDDNDYGSEEVALQLYVRRIDSGPWSYVTDIATSDQAIQDITRLVYDGGIECEISGARFELEKWITSTVVFGQGLGVPIVVVSQVI